ncbi:MAG: lipid-A-disaccharide synthase [Kiritimatiellae bacterium]|jgi:lipid-A-disaccharide synthase|nr:lipid-A-disaccharide synthase [Kiritimatiellia bacterium]
MTKPLKIYICAGEVSGDMHASALMKALKTLSPSPLEFRGFGGDAMRDEGAELLYHTDQTGVCGITPVLMELPFLLRMMKHLKKDMLQWQPDLVLTVDYPGMNLRLAKFAHEQGLKTIHYICPQVWAWHRSRIPRIAEFLDMLICLFPFEPKHFASTPLKPVFTGHPLVDRVRETRAEVQPEFLWKGKYKIAMLPGSRAGEITRILPRMLDSAVLLEQKLEGNCSFIIPCPTEKMRIKAKQIAKGHTNKPANLQFIIGQARNLLMQADAAAIASGTATLEASMMLCPSVLVYAVGRITCLVARLLITGVRFAGLANIIAGKEIMPELLQQDFTPEKLSEHLYQYVTNEQLRQQTISNLKAANALLGNGNAADQTARTILDFLTIQKHKSNVE